MLSLSQTCDLIERKKQTQGKGGFEQHWFARKQG